jgi:putative MATE family efflux protein
MSQSSYQENKMGIMPINKLLITMSLPMMISMLVQACYNIVDSIFVAQINENALTAVSLAFPVQNLMIAVATGTGVGVNALLSRSLGEKDSVKVNKAASNGVFIQFISFLVFAILGLIFSKIFFEVQTDIGQIIDYGYSYLSICTIGSFGLFGEVIFERILQSTGKTFYTMITQGTGAIINIIFDPILIFGLFGFPKMGIAGAALATITGQIVAMLLAVYFNITKNHEVEYKIRGFRPDKQIIGKIFSVGIPSIFMISIGSVMIFVMNKILIAFTATATAVFGVYFRLQSFVFMPVFGLNNGMIPIVAYNYGAQKKQRIIMTIKYSVGYAMGIMLVGFVLFQVFPTQLLAMFNASNEMQSIGVYALRIISINFLFVGFCIIASSVFQALGNGILSLIISVARQLLVLLPAAFILAKLGGLNTVWWSFPISELASVVMCSLFLRYMYNKKIKYIDCQ